MYLGRPPCEPCEPQSSINRIRVSSNCVELIFVKVHLSTLGASRDAVFFFSILLSAKRFDPGGLNPALSLKVLTGLVDLNFIAV